MKIGEWLIGDKVKEKGKRLKYKCTCSCGFEALREIGDLNKSVKKTGNAMCKRCSNSNNAKTHGLTNHPAHKKWDAMIQRCTNPNNASWKYYGEKGITVCNRWLKFENFYNDIGNKLEHGLSIDRIDNSLGYEPNNCRIANPAEQVANRDNHNARFTKTQADEIARLYREGDFTYRSLGEKYKCDHSIIRRIVLGQQKYYKKEEE